MTVKEFLKNQLYLLTEDIAIKVYQLPVKEIDICKALVRRYQGEISVALKSNQNYLDFDMQNYYYDNGYLIIICQPNKEQEKKTIEAYYDGKG